MKNMDGYKIVKLDYANLYPNLVISKEEQERLLLELKRRILKDSRIKKINQINEKNS